MLGKAYWFEEKWALDEALLIEALKGQTGTLGPEHPDTLESMRVLGELVRPDASLCSSGGTLTKSD